MTSTASRASKWQSQSCVATCLFVTLNFLYLLLKDKMILWNQTTWAHKVFLKNSIVKSFGLGAGCKKIKAGVWMEQKKKNMLRKVPGIGLRHVRACLRNGWTLGFLPIAESRILKRSSLSRAESSSENVSEEIGSDFECYFKKSPCDFNWKWRALNSFRRCGRLLLGPNELYLHSDLNFAI